MTTLQESLSNIHLSSILRRLNRESDILGLWRGLFNTCSLICANASNSFLPISTRINSDLTHTSNAQMALHNVKSEFKELQSELSNAGAELSRDTVAPLDQFLEHYQGHRSAVQASGKSVIESIAQLTTDADQLKKRYWNLEKELSEKGLSKEKAEELRKKLGEARGAYSNYVVEANKKISEKQAIYESLMASICDIEESKVELLKSLLQREVTCLESMGKILIDKATALASIASFISVESELELIKGECFSKSKVFIPIEFVPYNSDGALQPKIYDKYFLSTDSMSEESISQFFKNTIESLKAGRVMPLEEKAHVVELLHHSHSRRLLAENLRDINTPIELSSLAALKSLGEIINYMLTAFVLEKDGDPYILTSVLNASGFLYHKEEGGFLNLGAILSAHGIWQDPETWDGLIGKEIERFSREILEKKLAATGMKGLMGAFKDKIVVGTIKKQPTDSPQKTKIMKNSVMTVLRQFTNYLIMFRVKPEIGIQLLRKYQKIHELDMKHVKEYILDIKTHQYTPFGSDMEKPKAIRIQKMHRQRVEYQHSGMLIGMGLSLKYFTDCKDLKAVLLLNKKINGVLKAEVYKKVLLRTHFPVSDPGRFMLWEFVLGSKAIEDEYTTKLKEKLRNGVLPTKKVDNIILLDVERSFKCLKAISPESVTNILRAYALYDRDIEYCQGMNYVAGFLLLCTRNEASAFALLAGLIKKFSMQRLYAEGVPLLRCKFYQMDRIVHMHLPNLAEFLRSEGVNASLYSSGWIITLFAASIEAVNVTGDEVEKPVDLLMAIWDSFLAMGWKAIFKAGVFLLRKFEKSLLELKFEEVLHFVADIPKTEVWKSPEMAKEFKEEVKKIKITNSMLEVLEAEYKEVFETGL